jgi:hypothetical protein
METNKNIDNLLNECLERIFHGENLEEVLKSCPAEAKELRPLLQTALMVKKAAAISPSPEFRARARYEFHQTLLREKTAKQGFSFNFLPRWAAAVSLALAVVLASGGAVAASTNSMPDSPLYPVKLATEQAHMTITFSDEAKAELYAEQTDTRVAEIIYMANKGDTAQITALSQRLDERMNNMVVVTRAAYGKNNQSNIPVVNGPQSTADSANPKAAAPATAPPMVAGSGAVNGSGANGTGQTIVQSANATAIEAAPPVGTPAPFAAAPASAHPQPGVNTARAPEKTDSPAKAATANENKEQRLKAILTAYAVKHPAELRSILGKLPEPAKQDILRAIAVTAAGYDNALRSIEQP